MLINHWLIINSSLVNINRLRQLCLIDSSKQFWLVFSENKLKRLTSRDKLISVDCWSQSIVDLSWLSISVDCRSQSIVDLSRLSISVDCRSQLIVDLSQLSISVDCQSQSIVNLSWLFWGFGVRQMDGLTTLVVKSLSRLKIKVVKFNHSAE